jgi:glyoxylate reductase
MPDRARRPKVYVTMRLPPAVEARMAELFDTEINLDGAPLDGHGLRAAVRDCDVLVPTVTDRIDAAVLGAASPRLKLIANFGVGVNHIDLAAARARGILVSNTPGVLTDDTADTAMALILWTPRRFAEGERIVREGVWRGWSPSAMLGHRVTGKTLGIIGLGRIGRAVAARALGFGLKVRYHQRHRLPAAAEAEAGGAVFHGSIDEMLPYCDILSVNCPLTASTHHLLDARRLKLLPPHAYIVNTARGEVIDEAALADALADGVIAGAGLDVFEREPEIEPRLRELPNVVLLPHMGSATFEGRRAMGEKVITNIRAWSDGHRPPDQVLEGWA